MNKKIREILKSLFWITVGSAVFAFGFDLFLVPHQIGAGGITGLAIVVNSLLPFLSVGVISLIINIPLFLAGYKFVGKRFFWGSLAGMAISSVLIDVFAIMPELECEPLLGAVFGGISVGAGCGIVFMQGASTGGVDIIGRLLKCRFQNLSIGKLVLVVDLCIAAITGIAFHDVTKALYCTVALYISSIAVDAVVYSFDYSHVALIISDKPDEIQTMIASTLDRGCTFLKGEGGYTGQKKKVILCAIKQRQAAELKELVMEQDPAAFMVLQQAHQVLGEGFDRYSKNQL